MSRFKRLSHVIWHCQYHIVWVPKYRFRILKSKIAEEVHNCIQAFCAQLGCEIRLALDCRGANGAVGGYKISRCTLGLRP